VRRRTGENGCAAAQAKMGAPPRRRKWVRRRAGEIVHCHTGRRVHHLIGKMVKNPRFT